MYKHEVHEPEGGAAGTTAHKIYIEEGGGGAAPRPLEGLERKSAKSLLGLKLSELDIKRDSQEKKPVQKSGQGESAQGREGGTGEGRGVWGGFSHLFFFFNLQF